MRYYARSSCVTGIQTTICNILKDHWKTYTFPPPKKKQNLAFSLLLDPRKIRIYSWYKIKSLSHHFTFYWSLKPTMKAAWWSQVLQRTAVWSSETWVAHFWKGNIKVTYKSKLLSIRKLLLLLHFVLTFPKKMKSETLTWNIHFSSNQHSST